MDKKALKKSEYQNEQEAYSVKNLMVSSMVVSINNIEYNREENLLQRTNENYNVRLHFQNNDTRVINNIKTILKQEYIKQNEGKDGKCK